MFRIGQVFNKDGYDFCILDLIDYNGKKYALLSVEKEQIEYLFYEIVHNEDGYELIHIYDNEIEFALFNIFENKGE